MRWDWSKVKAHLVPSIAGKHEGWPAVIKYDSVILFPSSFGLHMFSVFFRTGHPRLMAVVRKMAMRGAKGKGSKELILECQVCVTLTKSLLSH